MRSLGLSLVLLFVGLLSASAQAQSSHESSQDVAMNNFVAASMAVHYDHAIAQGRGRGRRAEPFMAPNDGSVSTFIAACGLHCSAVRIELRGVGGQRFVAINSADSPHQATLVVPSQLVHSLANLEFRISFACSEEDDCYYHWALLGAAPYLTRGQRGLLLAPSDAEWNAAPPLRGAMQWASRPSGDDLQFFYPINAQHHNQSGSARLQCLIGATGALRCRVHDETPAGAGFGDGARGVSTLLRAGPTDAAGQATAGHRIEIPVRFTPPSTDSVATSAGTAAPTAPPQGPESQAATSPQSNQQGGVWWTPQP